MIDLASIPSLIRLGLFELGRKIGLFRGLNHTLLIKVYDKRGKLKAIRFVRQKLMLNNFRNILGAYLVQESDMVSAPGILASASAVDVGGVSRTLPIVAHSRTLGYYQRGCCFSGQDSYDTEAGLGKYGVRIRVGTGTVTPARDDYALASEYASGVPTRTIGADYIAWSVAITLTVGADITEAGMSVKGHVGGVDITAWTEGDILLFRDTFTAVSIADGEAISITERLTL